MKAVNFVTIIRNFCDKLKTNKQTMKAEELIKDKAESLFTDFAVYDWNEETGYEQNEELTKQKIYLVIDIVIDALEYTLVETENDLLGTITFWNELKMYVFKNY